ncbi:MAG TPA: TPM domain-containing protein [Firmicutes bacterium]|nr:TPM domain-containing protein [Bacillota bacterium]HOQ24481.1 TPM domain-containing protein [Bacillota bacterium]HPT67302.1 TPM domain-containing protein [Bacillota bacterium]
MRKNGMVWGVIMVIIIVVVGVVQVGAVTELPVVAGYVTDTAAMLTEQERLEISVMLSRYAKETDNQIVVVTIPALEGEKISEYASRLAEKLKPGLKGKGNGVLLLIAREDRTAQMQVSNGLAKQLTDSRAGAIIRNGLAPEFRKGDYAGGIRTAVAGIINTVTPDFPLNSSFVPPAAPLWDGRLNGLLLMIFWLIAVVVAIRSSRQRVYWYRRGYSSGFDPYLWGLWFRADYGGYTDDKDFIGGGGEFDGGGAGGSW